MQTPTKSSSLAGLALAVCLIGQLAVVMAGAAAIGWGKPQSKTACSRLLPHLEKSRSGAASLETGGTATKPSVSQHWRAEPLVHPGERDSTETPWKSGQCRSTDGIMVSQLSTIKAASDRTARSSSAVPHV